MIEDKMLNELDPNYSSYFQNLFSLNMSCQDAKEIRKNLKKSIEGTFNKRELRQFLGNRKSSDRYLLRLGYTAMHLYYLCKDGGIDFPRGIQKENAILKGKKRLELYSEILWEAKDNDYLEQEYGEIDGKHFRHLFQEFYKFFFDQETQGIIWKALLKKCTSINDYNLVLKLHQESLHEIRDENEVNMRYTQFFRLFPIKDYLSIHTQPLVGSNMIMPVILFIQSFQTLNLSDLLLVNNVLSRCNQTQLKKLIYDLEQSEALSQEEIKIFKENYSFPDQPT